MPDHGSLIVRHLSPSKPVHPQAKKRYKHCYASSHFAYSLDVLLVRHRFISFNVPRLPALLALFSKVSSTERHTMLVDASWQSRISYTLALVRLYHASPKKAIDFSVKCQKVKCTSPPSPYYLFLSFKARSISRLASFFAKSWRLS